MYLAIIINRNTYDFQHCIPCFATCRLSWFGTSRAGCLKYRVQGQSGYNEQCHSNHNQFSCHGFQLWKLIIFSDIVVFEPHFRRNICQCFTLFSIWNKHTRNASIVQRGVLKFVLDVSNWCLIFTIEYISFILFT